MCIESFNINWTIVKDIALVILSAGALLSGFILAKRNRTDQWITDFRNEIANLVSIYTSIEHNYTADKSSELSRVITVIFILLDDSKKNESDLMKTIRDFQGLIIKNKDFLNKPKDYFDNLSNGASQIIQLTKAIIKEKQTLL